MKITENEMRGLLTGKCVPGDMKVNEELPAYLVRKFAYLQQKLDVVEAKLMSVTESRDQWEANAHGFSRCADRLEAQLAELAKQEPVAYRRFVKDEHDRRLDCYEYFDFQGVGNKREPLFTRPAPAVNLSELVPDGWKLVPVEPTRQMCDAFDKSSAWEDVEFWEGRFNLASGWEAMLASAPSPSHDL